jgi:hypothetical protein
MLPKIFPNTAVHAPTEAYSALVTQNPVATSLSK